tara:strand:- start:2631 stop:3860 length:1230 start_codon:yes stop_codon:yes gene_type:complete
MNEKTYDAIIIGGGLTGLLTTYALSSKGFNVAIVDKSPFNSIKNIKLDFRTTAISEGSKIFLDKIGIWQKLGRYSEPIKKIIVYDRDESNKIEFQNSIKKSYLGYVVENQFIKKILLENISRKKNVKILESKELIDLEINHICTATLSNKNEIKSEILIAADGKNSFVRKLIKTPAFNKNYNHTALVMNVSHAQNHKNIAYEIFFKNGPLAILPMKKKLSYKFLSSVIWTHNSDYFKNLESVDKKLFQLFIEGKLEKYLGKIHKILNMRTFNLSAHINSNFSNNRLVYIGDAAHSMHPIAGQGWNVGIRDIENLLYSIEEGLSLGLALGDNHICKNYHSLSYKDAFSMYQITDKLNSAFLFENFISKKIRHIGIDFINRKRNLKNLISNYAMGKKISSSNIDIYKKLFN